MALLTLNKIYFSVGEFPLLDYVDLEINPKERIALIGRNGQGKSTLLKILSQNILPDAGEILKSPVVTVASLAQDLPPAEDITVFEAVAGGLQDLRDLLVQYHDVINQVDNHDEAWMNQIHSLQERIEQQNGWQIQQRIERVMQELSLPDSLKMSELSGGWRRRVALAAALVQAPDILCLDEPTNHLDLEAIEWLEKMLLNYEKTIIFITHDRALLRKLATRILEIDRGKLTSFPSDYDVYLERKEQFLADEERANALFDKKLSDEEQWIRQGVKARRTRNEGRVRALKSLRVERQLRRERQDKPVFTTQDLAAGKGKTVVQAEGVSFEYTAGRPIISDLSFTIQRGDKISIVGKNGTGKTTLVKLLLGYLQPTEGTVKQSPTNQIAFFDQTREHLEKESTVMDNVASGDDFVEIGGKRKHVIGYLGDFLFSPDKCRASARTLSGGEQNRLLLAKLFAKPANVLVLDEPTNDLDIESLEVLEELLLNYQGTVIIISHDREFIDNIATHCIAIEEGGKLSISVGGYSDWLQRKTNVKKAPVVAEKVKATKPVAKNTKKLSYQDQRELESLPLKIEKLEAEVNQLEAKMGTPEFYNLPAQETKAANAKLVQLKEELAQAYQRWEALD